MSSWEAEAKSNSPASFPSEPWVMKWVGVINDDSEIARLGRWLTGNILFQFGEERYLLQVDHGRVTDVLVNPIWDKSWDFAVKASVDTWEKSIQQVPPPFYQDIFGMMWNHGMTLEGNVVKAMQHIRALKLMMAAMKRVS
ncbi:MAG: hypothetical protein K6T83_18420 [Alicyclobacillus sp.]|nr:hypothetical protein [Alicyclobacillus sp.]